MSVEFKIPAHIFTGEGALEEAKPVLSTMGRRCLLVSGTVTGKSSEFAAARGMLEGLGIDCAVFTDVAGEPTDLTVKAGLEAFRAHRADCMLAMGGGSALDTMKAVGLLASCGGEISDYLGKTVSAVLPFMAAVPTTAGTGSEATKFTVITDTATGVKMLLAGPSLLPELAIVDPAYSLSAPRSVTVATGLDALTHSIESYVSRKAQPLTDAVAISSVRRIFKYLPRAYNSGADAEARGQMSVAALEGGISISNASVTLVHGMSRPIGANFHVSHGISNAMLLEKCLGFMLDSAPGRFADLARAIGAASPEQDDGQAALALVAAVKELCTICHVPTLGEYGIDREAFFAAIDRMSEDALKSGSPGNLRKEVTREQIAALYKSLWD